MNNQITAETPIVFTPTVTTRPQQQIKTNRHDMNEIRQEHTATLLKDGTVLVSGGSNSIGPQPWVEIYDPSIDAWTTVSRMYDARVFHTATLLQDGNVLVIGGQSQTDSLKTAEIFDVTSRTWKRVRRMKYKRDFHSATLLQDGKILVVGGAKNEIAHKSAEVYDPSDDTWTLTSSMMMTRGLHTATLIDDGRVMVIGGRGNEELGMIEVEFFHPVERTWIEGPELFRSRVGHTATLLQNGNVLVVGGGSPDYEIFDPVQDKWIERGPIEQNRRDHTATLLQNGNVLVTGGGETDNTAEIYDTQTHKWNPSGELIEGRATHTATLLKDGRVLVAGGSDHIGSKSHAEIYDPDTGRWMRSDTVTYWQTTSEMNIPRSDHTATLLDSGDVLIVGGRTRLETDAIGQVGGVGFVSKSEIYSIEKREWTLGAEVNEARAGHVAISTNGRVFIFGGIATILTDELDPRGDKLRALVYRDTVEEYDPVTNQWEIRGKMNVPRWKHTATLLQNGKILIVGGQNDSGILDSAEIFDPVNGEFEKIDNMIVKRSDHAALLLNNGDVLILGGTDNMTAIYDHISNTWKSAANLIIHLARPHAVVLQNGFVLVVGGYFDGISRSESYMYIPKEDIWTKTESPPDAIADGSLTVLNNGDALVTTHTSNSTYIFEMSTQKYKSVGEMINSLKGPAAVLLNNGVQVLVTGGEQRNYGITNKSEIFSYKE